MHKGLTLSLSVALFVKVISTRTLPTVKGLTHSLLVATNYVSEMLEIESLRCQSFKEHRYQWNHQVTKKRISPLNLGGLMRIYSGKETYQTPEPVQAYENLHNFCLVMAKTVSAVLWKERFSLSYKMGVLVFCQYTSIAVACPSCLSQLPVPSFLAVV